MLIDWFTVGAQLLNFLILVWLLKRFLYQPILDAIDAREKRIADELADADAKKAEAKQERDTFQDKNTAFEQQRAALMSQATDAAKAERQKLLDEARQAAEALSSKRQEALRNEAQSLSQTIGQRTRREVFAIAHKALADLASARLEESMTEAFLRRLRELDEPTRNSLGDSLRTASEPALIRSAFELPPEQRAAIQDALNQAFSADLALRFETAPEQIGGIELTTNGQKLAWSIDAYLVSLEHCVDELVNARAAATTTA